MFVRNAKIVFDDKHLTIRDYQVEALQWLLSRNDELLKLSLEPNIGKTTVSGPVVK